MDFVETRQRLSRSALGAVLALVLATAGAASPADWVLSYQGQSTNRFIWDKRTAGLVRKHVPAPLSGAVIAGLGGPPDPVFVTGRRYLRVSACVPHDCGDKGFFWIDSQTGAALGAHLAGDVLRIGSNDFAPGQVPGLARQALLDWLTEQDIQPGKVEFVQGDGRSVVLAQENFAPRSRYHPSANGPSFDCGKAATDIEKAICNHPGLAKDDLEMAELVHRIHQGHGTTGARRQLLALQRTWLKTRDAECRSAADVPACLRHQYRSQYERLMNWIPAR
jgi:uncharacterized protein YecT (DUF1311 family)